MNRYDCNRVQDLLPSLARGDLLEHEITAAQHHVDACDACREELALVTLIRHSLDPVPAALEARVLAAVNGGGRGRQSSLRALPQRRLAMAAAIATAVIGGSLLLDRADMDGGSPTASEFELAGVAGLNWPAQDPLLDPAPLDELTVEELEVLLAEMN